MSIDKPKRISSKYQPSLNPKQIQQKAKILMNRLSRQNICNQIQLIKYMNPKLQIKTQQFKKDPLFQRVKIQDIYKVLSKVQCIKRVDQLQKSFKGLSQQKNMKKQNVGKDHSIYQQTKFKIQYQNMDRTILSTGINKDFIKQALRLYGMEKNQYSEQNHHPSQKINKFCNIVGYNDYWISIQAINSLEAFNLKLLIRNKKRQMDANLNASYKQDKKRVRIIMLNQDFYTLLVDAMSEKKSKKFASKLLSINQYNAILYGKQLDIQNSYSKQKRNLSREISKNAHLSKRQLFYVPIQTGYQTSGQSVNQHKEDDNLNNNYINSTLDDFVSEDLSKNSQAVDSRKIDDLIQTSEQGIQAQNQMTDNLNMHYQESRINHSNKAQYQSNEQQYFRTILDNNMKADIKELQSHQFEQNQKQLILDKFQAKNTQLQKSKNNTKLLSQSNTNLPEFSHSVFLHLKQISSQTMLKYSQLKKYENQFTKKTKYKNIMSPGVPQQFKQISDQMRYKGKFFQSLSKKMFKMNQPKKMEWQQ